MSILMEYSPRFCQSVLWYLSTFPLCCGVYGVLRLCCIQSLVRKSVNHFPNSAPQSVRMVCIRKGEESMRLRTNSILERTHCSEWTLEKTNSTTVINRIVLNFLSASSERKANIQLYFSSWSIECVECFTSLSPFSLSLVANSRSWENSIDGWLVERNSCFFLKLPCKTPWSKCWISSCQTSYHFFHHSIRSVYWNAILWSTSFGNHSHFSLDTITSKPFTHTLTRYWKKRSYFVDFLLSIKNFLKKLYSHLQHRKTDISWSHGDRVIMIKGLNTSYHSISFFISFLSY